MSAGLGNYVSAHRFFGVGQFYADFRQVSDDEVVDLLRRAADEEPTVAGAADPPLRND
jgi:predicted phosphoribosyltransferase